MIAPERKEVLYSEKPIKKSHMWIIQYELPSIVYRLTILSKLLRTEPLSISINLESHITIQHVGAPAEFVKQYFRSAPLPRCRSDASDTVGRVSSTRRVSEYPANRCAI
ncbi:jg3695 [Pararge aegeria aegeria]|uniref:Jg3695 protein n=1 Tax=Pararge aegeria aegeria TaxID=348720 RepID=A0A8S4S6F6_9NEOP|nr:jg3695 [Pararge aegeria aegeria]